MPADAIYGSRSVIVRCLLDSTAMCTFIRQDVADKLKLPRIRKEYIAVLAFADRESKKKYFDVVSVQIRKIEDPDTAIEFEALVSQHITGIFIGVPEKELNELLIAKGLQSVEISHVGSSSDVQILIGADNYFRVNTGKIIRLNESLSAIESIFEFCLQGKRAREVSSWKKAPVLKSGMDAEVLACNVNTADLEVDRAIQAFGEMKALGILMPLNENQTAESKEILEQFNNNIQFRNKRNEVKLPFKDIVKVSDNSRVAERRLFSLIRRFQADPKLFEEYKRYYKIAIKGRNYRKGRGKK